MLIPNFY
ncbi:hypothetical protein GQ607_017926 [Colletotrichum asianum]|nr:hypothetical protein GQ607_017926 [Colletotrichum asianum]